MATHTAAQEGYASSLAAEIAQSTALFASDKKLAQRASERLNLFETMFETVPVGVIMADATGRIVYGNSHVETMVGHPVHYSEDPEEYVAWKSFHPDGRRVESEEYPLYRVLFDDEDHCELDVHYERGDGSRFWMRIIGKAVKDPQGELIGATVALVDIDEERRLQKMQKVLIAELNHRVKNAFSVVKSIVAQSLRGEDVPAGLRDKLDDRLQSYAIAHSRLVGKEWDSARLDEIAKEIVHAIERERVHMTGSAVSIPGRQALAFSMAFYELATNSVKYGSLSVPKGRVELDWKVTGTADDARLHLTWREVGGPPCSEPKTRGFGSFITGRGLAAETGGKVSADYGIKGLQWTLEMPMKKLEIES